MPKLNNNVNTDHRVLDVKDLVVQFPIGEGTYFNALKGISFHVNKGEVVGLVGESGSGKSTTAKAILGLVEHSSGHVKISNELVPNKPKNIKGRINKWLASKVQMIFQDAKSSLNPREKIYDIISEGVKNQKLFEKTKTSSELKIGQTWMQENKVEFGDTIFYEYKETELAYKKALNEAQKRFDDANTEAFTNFDDQRVAVEGLKLSKTAETRSYKTQYKFTKARAHHLTYIIDRFGKDKIKTYLKLQKHKDINEVEKQQILKSKLEFDIKTAKETNKQYSGYTLHQLIKAFEFDPIINKFNLIKKNTDTQKLAQELLSFKLKWDIEIARIENNQLMKLTRNKVFNLLGKENIIKYLANTKRTHDSKILVNKILKSKLWVDIQHINQKFDSQFDHEKKEMVRLKKMYVNQKKGLVSVLAKDKHKINKIWHTYKRKNIDKYRRQTKQDGSKSQLALNSWNDFYTKQSALLNKRQFYRKVVKDAMNAVSMSPEFVNRFPGEFSGGQAQRIAIARTIAMESELIIADEPISALDVSIQAQVINLLKKLIREKNLTILFIAHDLQVVRYISNRIVVMYKGEIVEQGDAQEVYHNPVHPYTQSLVNAVPSIDHPERLRNSKSYKSNDYEDFINFNEVKKGWAKVNANHFVFGQPKNTKKWIAEAKKNKK